MRPRAGGRPLAAAVLVAAGALAGCGGSRPPELVLPQKEIDGGAVRTGATVELVLPAANRGGQDLILLLQPECGCTITRPRLRIAPGRSEPIRLAVRTGHSALAYTQGPVRTGLTLRTNDPARPTAYASLLLTMRPYVYAWPSVRRDVVAAPGGRARADFILVPTDEHLLRPPRVAAAAGVRARVVPWRGRLPIPGMPEPSGARSGYRVAVEVPAARGPDPQLHEIPVELDHPAQHRLILQVVVSPGPAATVPAKALPRPRGSSIQ